MAASIFEQFVTIWVVVDPIGTIPVFVAVTASLAPSAHRWIAVQAALTAAGVLLFFLVAGQFLIDALGISLPAFQIAGGLILFLFALTMIFGDSKPERETADAVTGDAPSPAIFPLAVPSIASPGAMLTVVLLTDNNRFSISEQVVTAAILLSVLACALVLMLLAGPILKLIGKGGRQLSAGSWG